MSCERRLWPLTWWWGITTTTTSRTNLRESGNGTRESATNGTRNKPQEFLSRVWKSTVVHSEPRLPSHCHGQGNTICCASRVILDKEPSKSGMYRKNSTVLAFSSSLGSDWMTAFGGFSANSSSCCLCLMVASSSLTALSKVSKLSWFSKSSWSCDTSLRRSNSSLSKRARLESPRRRLVSCEYTREASWDAWDLLLIWTICWRKCQQGKVGSNFKPQEEIPTVEQITEKLTWQLLDMTIVHLNLSKQSTKGLYHFKTIHQLHPGHSSMPCTTDNSLFFACNWLLNLASSLRNLAASSCCSFTFSQCFLILSHCISTASGRKKWWIGQVGMPHASKLDPLNSKFVSYFKKTIWGFRATRFWDIHKWAVIKTLVTLSFHYTEWFVGILMSWLILIPIISLYNWTVCHPLCNPTNQGFDPAWFALLPAPFEGPPGALDTQHWTPTQNEA